MARVRHIEIRNFRYIQELTWAPSAGVNCLIGPGDSGKSSFLDAIEPSCQAELVLKFWTDAPPRMAGIRSG